MAKSIFRKRTLLTISSLLMLCIGLVVTVSRAQESPIPRVWSLVPDATSPRGTAQFVVTFSEAVTGVDAHDFQLTGDSSDAYIQQVDTSTNPAVFIVHVVGQHANSRILLQLIDDDSIHNSTGIPLGGTGNDNGNALSTAAARIVAPDTTITDQPLPSPKSYSYPVGEDVSMVLTKPGNIPVMSYYDRTNGDLKLAICNDTYCGKPIIRTIDSTGDVGRYTSLALTSTNIPVISYYDVTNFHIKLAICNDTTCSTSTIRNIDTALPSLGSSLALTSANIPVISFTEKQSVNSNYALKIAICGNTMCSSTTYKILDGGIGKSYTIGDFSSLALTSTNNPVISYQDFTNAYLKLVICNNPSCTTPAILTLDTSGHVGYMPSLKLYGDVPIISYFDNTNNDLKWIHCGLPSCSPWNMRTVRTIDSSGSVGTHPSLAITKSGIPLMSYYDFDNRTIKLATCTDQYCTPTIPTTNIAAGLTSALALTSDDVPVISYYDQDAGMIMLYLGTRIVDQGFPYPFAKTAPTNNAINQPTSATLKWASSRYANYYEYCITTSIDSCTNWIYAGNVTQITLFGLAKNTTYYWQMRATSFTGTTYATDVYWKFTTVK